MEISHELLQEINDSIIDHVSTVIGSKLGPTASSDEFFSILGHTLLSLTTQWLMRLEPTAFDDALKAFTDQVRKEVLHITNAANSTTELNKTT